MAGEVETGRVKSPFKSPRKQWNPSSVESDDYLVSLTRRLDVLEQKLVGKRSLKADQPPLAPTVKVGLFFVFIYPTLISKLVHTTDLTAEAH